MTARDAAMEVLEKTEEVIDEPVIARHRITVDDYHLMAEAGVLGPEARVELIDGEVIDMAPMGTRHFSMVARLSGLLHDAVGRRALVLTQMPLRLSRSSEPEPDLAVVRWRDDFYDSGHPGPADALLVIEVADSTLPYDLKIKAPLYARHSVPEYWIIDLAGNRLRRFAGPAGDTWTETSVTAHPGSVALPGLPGVAIDLSGLL